GGPSEKRKSGVANGASGGQTGGGPPPPPPRLGGEERGGGTQHERAFGFTPSPPLPRKRGREQIELVALTDVIGMSVEERMTRRMLLAALTSVALLSAAAPGMAQTGDDFPNRPIRIIVPQAAGSGV